MKGASESAQEVRHRLSQFGIWRRYGAYTIQCAVTQQTITLHKQVCKSARTVCQANIIPGRRTTQRVRRNTADSYTAQTDLQSHSECVSGQSDGSSERGDR